MCASVGYEIFTGGDCWISGIDLCLRPADEMLLVGLGGDDGFGSNGCEITESLLLARCGRGGCCGYEYSYALWL